MTTLIVANKCYSSWSLRPWLLMTELGLTFEEVLVPLGAPDFTERVLAHAPGASGKVPCLVDGEVTVWESLAIMDYLADAHLRLRVWPEDIAARAHARAISAEMHAGFQGLRSACPMNLGRRYAARDRGEAVARDAARITALWREARERFGAAGPFLYGAFTAADAMYAPVVTRFETYSISVDPVSRAYMDAVLGTRSMCLWREAALREPWIYRDDEIDEPSIEDLRTNLAPSSAPESPTP